MKNETLDRQIELAHEAVTSLSPEERARLHAMVRKHLKKAMDAGELPAAVGYHVVIAPDAQGRVHLGAELCDAQGEVVHGPVSIGEIELDIL